MFGTANLGACHPRAGGPRFRLELGLSFGSVPPAELQLSAQLGMLGNCGTSSGFVHLRRRFVNISSFGSMPSG
jgi:hypothetical protein